GRNGEACALQTPRLEAKRGQPASQCERAAGSGVGGGVRGDDVALGALRAEGDEQGRKECDRGYGDERNDAAAHDPIRRARSAARSTSDGGGSRSPNHAGSYSSTSEERSSTRAEPAARARISRSVRAGSRRSPPRSSRPASAARKSERRASRRRPRRMASSAALR